MGRRVLSGLLFVFGVVLLALSLERRAYAYVDPGSSLVLFQSIGAAFSAGLFYFRKRLFGWFRGRRPAENGRVGGGTAAVKKAE